MLQKLILFLMFCTLLMRTYAAGTPAGTVISNTADIHYALGGIGHHLASNTNTFRVDRVVDVQIVWEDSAPVKVGAGEQGRVLTFRLTNLGNGDDNITVAYEHNTSSDFVPHPAQIHMDTNGNGVYDPGVDVPVSDTNLSADTNATLFIVADIPNDANVTQHSSDGILATSTSAATAGADHPDQVDVVIRTGTSRDQGTYVVRDYWLQSRKSVVVHSDDNATHTGTVLTYTIDFFIGGHAAGRTISGIRVHDSIPAGTAYRAGSLRLDDTNLSDPADSDAGNFDGGAIHVRVGTISGTAHKTVRFDARVQ